MRIIKRLSLLVLLSIIVFAPIRKTNASFNARTKVEGVSFSTGEWESGVKINEVYYDSVQSGVDGEYEWVELYNRNNNSPVLLSGWVIIDNYSEDEIPEVALPAEGFVVVAATESGFSENFPNFEGLIVYISDGEIGNGLSNSGDKLILKNELGEQVDYVAWEGVSGWDLEADDGESIARKSAGEDEYGDERDWEILGDGDDSGPNPGTNPHSHINVDIERQGQELFISFENATGFNKVEYAVYYDREYEGEIVDTMIEDSVEKDLDQDKLALEPIYLGTCSSLGQVCTPHENIENLKVSIMYKNDAEIIGIGDYYEENN